MRLPSRSYQELPEQAIDELISQLALEDLRKHFLRIRWLRESVRAENLSRRLRNQFTLLRSIEIAGGILTPVLVGFNVDRLWIAIISLLVAFAIGFEQFFKFGERWLHYRNVAEWLKIEGWQFLQLSGPHYGSYQGDKRYEDAFPMFAARISEFLLDQEQGSILRIQQERVKGKKTQQGDDEQSPKSTN